ncbi:hypothetical protein D3C71_1862100 [compost metagenome]
MRQHANDHFGIVPGKFDELVGDDQRAIRKRKRIWSDHTALAEIERVTGLAAA